MSKCNKTEDEEEYGPHPEGPPLLDTMFAKNPAEFQLPPPPPPANNLSCSNPDLIQVFWHNFFLIKSLFSKRKSFLSDINFQDTQMWDRNNKKQGKNICIWEHRILRILLLGPRVCPRVGHRGWILGWVISWVQLCWLGAIGPTVAGKGWSPP